LQENGFPDILCTQETSGKFYRLLADKMDYPHTFNLKKGTVILSRFPILAGGDVQFENTSNSTLWADIKVGEKKVVRVYNIHLQSNRVTKTTAKVIEKGDLDEEETWQDIGFVLGRVGSATSLRAEQAQKLREHIAACKLPVIICGDFNDTPNSYVYSLLSDGFHDTFRQKALGLGTTFGGALPLLRIDYILTEKSITTFSCRTIRDGDFSDHYPVFAALGICNVLCGPNQQIHHSPNQRTLTMSAIKYNKKGFTKETLLHLYEQLAKPRLIEEKMLNLLRQGKISKWFSGIGQEAISVGAACALLPMRSFLPCTAIWVCSPPAKCHSTACFVNGKANALATPKPATALSTLAPWNTASWA
jgi:endonuclease/exonuclease/phosphatase family metal-dependent hydrolase